MTEAEQGLVYAGAGMGFSAKYIARRVLGRATEKNVRRVQNCLYIAGLKLGDYRNGRTDQSKKLWHEWGRRIRREETAKKETQGSGLV